MVERVQMHERNRAINKITPTLKCDSRSLVADMLHPSDWATNHAQHVATTS